MKDQITTAHHHTSASGSRHHEATSDASCQSLLRLQCCDCGRKRSRELNEANSWWKCQRWSGAILRRFA